MSTDYCVVLPLAPMPMWRDYTSRTPLHCTVFPWFSLPENDIKPNVAALFQDIVLPHAQASVRLIAVQPDYFGVLCDIPVHRVRSTEQLRWLHYEVYSRVKESAGVYSPRWVGVNYAPHVTSLRNSSFPSGSTADVDRLVVIERRGDIKRPLAHIIFANCNTSS